MKTYLYGKEKSLVIQKEDKVYLIWSVIAVLIIDCYIIKDNEITDCRVIAGHPHWEDSREAAEKIFKEMREGKLKEIDIKQYLTHENQHVRETIKEALNESIST